MDVDTSSSNHCEDEAIKEMPMFGKHQRNLSLSAKWANDKSMAVEFLRRQRDVVAWIESVLKRKLPTTDLFEALKSGVVLREMMEILFPDVSNCKSPISRHYSKRMAPWKERENISVFLRQCKSIGMNDLSMFCTDDLYEGTNMVQVLFCVQHFMLFSEEHVGHLFQPVAESQPAEFSNQELEAAMSKIEQAGVDANALRGLISPSNTTVSPVKPKIQEKNTTMSLDAGYSEFQSIQSKSNEKDSSPKTEGERKVEVVVEVCNQVEQDLVETPADVVGINPEQESGSDADDEAEETEPEDISDQEKVIHTIDDSPVHAVTAHDGAEVIQQILTKMVIVIDESEAEAKRVVFATTKAALGIVSEAVARIIALASLSKVDAPAAELLEFKPENESVDEENVRIELKDVEETEDIPAGQALAEGDIGAHPSVDALSKLTEGTADKKAEHVQEEELEAKAMAKCTCGRSCIIM
ncbi:hypothetical protein PHYBOEH_004895 [Phytophthora boehmeriae]|uniref:Calponin-homology (CH) domain-containing protein n=1 Tax=Phytophthora boehmeriae TaxID=109152 RepID=A0A8T1X8I2_9STRA|nr:hypothetical protein PHYBOEH_004895 [Phytophthora boehmeriae]